MKQIVPFTKTITFDTNVDEITSISLDKNIISKKDNTINGTFSLYLEYKENDISVNVLKFESTIPFDIDLDEKYLIENTKIDIDDFYYEIDDNKVKLNIDLLIDNLEYKESTLTEIIEQKNEEKKVVENEDRFIEKESIEDLFKKKKKKKIDVVSDNNSIPIFQTYDESKETYVTYKVHIVRDDDTVESICSKYEISKEDLSNYNEINVIKLGDKLIVPTYKK